MATKLSTSDTHCPFCRSTRWEPQMINDYIAVEGEGHYVCVDCGATSKPAGRYGLTRSAKVVSTPALRWSR